MNNKLLSLLGLACRAGHVVSGEYATENAVKSGKAKACIIAEDASDNTKKLFRDKCSSYGVPLIETGTKEELGKAIGKEFRASAAVTDRSFAEGLVKKYEKIKG
ncbi:MAG: ribosomal L7Ae/L30e/S12e/Gadd45 family protein [Lachnospiraceae bacterium]|nr:ribosomal L7Ae/L30e/S12e/Gadd45 family protein [Lachnospiraceae bacterium]